jgi:hypothetical protein
VWGVLARLPLGARESSRRSSRGSPPRSGASPVRSCGRSSAPTTTPARCTRGRSDAAARPYITHPVAVATNLASLGLGTATLLAALLHDTVEDTPATLEDIREGFGDEVALLVDGVTKLDRIQTESKQEQQAETLRKMVVAMARDIRVLVIKLADRLHNMQTIGVDAARQAEAHRAGDARHLRPARAPARDAGSSSWSSRTSASRRCTRSASRRSSRSSTSATRSGRRTSTAVMACDPRRAARGARAR